MQMVKHLTILFDDDYDNDDDDDDDNDGGDDDDDNDDDDYYYCLNILTFMWSSYGLCDVHQTRRFYFEYKFLSMPYLRHKIR